MAALITLTATTAEGQLLQIIEGIGNLQVAAQAAAPAGTTTRRIVTQNVTDDIAGVKTVALQIPIATEAGGAGLISTAIAVY